VISKDFDSPCLKNKKHWNSFNTAFLVPIEKVKSDLEQFGAAQKLSTEEIKDLLNTKLSCNTCGYNPKHMPDLKKHLLTHASDYAPLEKQ
jgi:aprataxin